MHRINFILIWLFFILFDLSQITTDNTFSASEVLLQVERLRL